MDAASSSTDLVPGQQDELSALAARINEEHEQCLSAARASLAHALEAGRLLTEAKSCVAHGGWLPWLQANCHFSERTAQLYLRVWKARKQLAEGNPQRVADLSLREAVALLAGSTQEREVSQRKRRKPQEHAIRLPRAGDDVPGYLRAIDADLAGHIDAGHITPEVLALPLVSPEPDREGLEELTTIKDCYDEAVFPFPCGWSSRSAAASPPHSWS